MAQERDNCQVCQGEHGGEPGNENRVEGVVMCDYCHAATLGDSALAQEARKMLRAMELAILLKLVQQYRGG